MTVVFLGAGTEAQAGIRYFKARGETDLFLHDDRSEAALPPAITIGLGDAIARSSGNLLLRSPGVPPTHPLLAGAAAAARLTTTPTGYWMAHYAPPGTVTVTGTKGKSTTTALLAELLQHGGLVAGAYGNIGRPPLDEPLPAASHPVLELSSYMMHDLPQADHFHIITSLYEDHLDWHGGVEAYHAAKLRPFRRERPAPGLAPRSVIAQHRLPASVRAFEDIVRIDGEKLSVSGSIIDPGPEERGFRSGPLQKALVAAAATAVRFLGADEAAKAASAAALSFKGLPCRQEIIPSRDGRLWIDDTLATIPEAAVDVLERFSGRDVVILVGGGDRGIDYQPLDRYLAGHPQVMAIGFGPAAKRITGLKLRVESLPEAIDAAEERCPKGGVILFSPAAPSSPPFASYKERSALFRQRAEKAS